MRGGRVENNLGKTTSSSFNRDSNLDLSVLGSLAKHKTSMLANYTTEAAKIIALLVNNNDSGGDVDIVVASDKEVKISPVREAFQAVFGKATVTGVAAQSISVATQPVGFESGINAAKERISSTRASGKLHKMQPILAVENFIVEVVEDKWYDTGVLLLHDPVRELSLHVFTQLTPVPASVVSVAQADTPDDYPLRSSGLSVTVGSLMGNNLQIAEDGEIKVRISLG
uniref:Non-canonical purine NTP phosphatase/PRRC1 domain-containing protein n=1 Tax=Timema tahoe TaxID=61484 RepID=A0A7R9NUH2_9NEOP|nr:unnamed protein product [Timema tahoe]